jgi:predicted nucleic acid-binding protein
MQPDQRGRGAAPSRKAAFRSADRMAELNARGQPIAPHGKLTSAAIDLDRYPTLPLMRRAYELRASLTAYDATLVALAEILDCELVTADRPLADAPGPRWVIRVLS